MVLVRVACVLTGRRSTLVGLEGLKKLLVAFHTGGRNPGKLTSSAGELEQICSTITHAGTTLAPYAYEMVIRRSAKEAGDTDRFISFSDVVNLDENPSELPTLYSLKDVLSHEYSVGLQSKLIATHLDGYLRSSDPAVQADAGALVLALSRIRLVNDKDLADIRALQELFNPTSEEEVKQARKHLKSSESRLVRACAVYPGLLALEVSATKFLQAAEADRACVAVFDKASPPTPLQLRSGHGVTDDELHGKMSRWAEVVKHYYHIQGNASDSWKTQNSTKIDKLGGEMKQFQEDILYLHEQAFLHAFEEFTKLIDEKLHQSVDAAPATTVPESGFDAFGSTIVRASMDSVSVENIYGVEELSRVHPLYDRRRRIVEALKVGVPQLMLPFGEVVGTHTIHILLFQFAHAFR